MISLNNNIMGIIFMTLGMFCLSVNDVVVKGLNISFPVWEVIFFRAFSGILVSFGLIFIFGSKSLKTKKPIRHFVRAFSAVGCVIFYFFGLKFVSNNILILFVRNIGLIFFKKLINVISCF